MLVLLLLLIRCCLSAKLTVRLLVLVLLSIWSKLRVVAATARSRGLASVVPAILVRRL